MHPEQLLRLWHDYREAKRPELAPTTYGREIRPGRPRREDWIFKSESGCPFNYSNFQRRQWRPVVEDLVRQRLVTYYGPQYHARHTAITLMLRSGLSVEDVAYLTRSLAFSQAHLRSFSGCRRKFARTSRAAVSLLCVSATNFAKIPVLAIGVTKTLLLVFPNLSQSTTILICSINYYKTYGFAVPRFNRPRIC